MMRQRTVWLVVGGMAILLFGQGLYASTLMIGASHAGIGVWIGASLPPPLYHPPEHRSVVVTGPWRHRFVRVEPPRHDVIVVRPPVIERVVIAPPPVVVRPCEPVVEEGTVTVWITNSNGSKTSVTLTRRGQCYIGPRNEWYTNMPTNEQLRLAYGF
jgi:hypothetical protein